MRYTVTWHPDAQDELTEIWLRATDRARVADAANQIDVDLSQLPDIKGVEFYGDRLFVSPPLAVTFSVSTQDLLVQVLQVWQPRET